MAPEKINKIDKSPARLTKAKKKKKKAAQIINIRSEKAITSNPLDIKWIIKEHYE